MNLKLIQVIGITTILLGAAVYCIGMVQDNNRIQNEEEISGPWCTSQTTIEPRINFQAIGILIVVIGLSAITADLFFGKRQFQGDTTQCNKQRFSEYLISVGLTLNILGAILNSFHQRSAFAVWIASNLLCAFYFAGAWREWWTVRASSEAKLCGTYLVFLVTATWGWMF